MSDYVPSDPRFYLKGHKANSLFRNEVEYLVEQLGDDFETYFEAGDPATAELLSTL